MLVAELMATLRAVGVALRNGDGATIAAAQSQVHRAKVELGERGPVWWREGTPDLNRCMASKTSYADWLATLEDAR